MPEAYGTPPVPAPNMNTIQVLVPDEARKIAAGEVIDRPASLVREFIDNAIDSGARNIDVSIDRGGIACTEVSDDGCGMIRDDLALCCLTHATSKIRSLDDLDRLSTLGFRGEALPAAASAARLEIVSSTDGREAWRLLAGPVAGADCAETFTPEPARRTRGSSVRAKNLFDTMPARKRFLKREGSEAALCMQAFIDKALPFPGINFRFLQDGKLKLFLPAVSAAAPYKKRFAAAVMDGVNEHFLHEIAASGKDFSIKIVIGGPELYRNDRRRQYVFANGRRINDFSLLQALEYGSQGCFPNGLHPVGAIFLEVDPSKADFNIHPAKREARFADASAIHHEITTALRSFFRHINLNRQQPDMCRKTFYFEDAGQYGENSAAGRGLEAGDREGGAAALERILSGEYVFEPLPGSGRDYGLLLSEDSAGSPATGNGGGAPASKLRYAGRVFDLFILVEDGDRLYIIDQHAAHERILYDRFLSEPVTKQDLLVPITFLTESDADDDFLASHRQELAKLGVIIDGGQGSWRIEALPALWRLGDGETVNAILGLRAAGENIAERWAATLACHGAVRDGDYLDSAAALALAEKALALPVRRCPHGRPILTGIKQDELLKAVHRPAGRKTQ
ncbi:MAG: DNA mismatch repair endonuclease MutL [Spirochaetaceae bacterium]|jgi:DNA mismatch repair protein MutL|nr:DNA mismatch repair endonuclease MutL [Spirochaetaceae bacterium]